MTRMLKQDSPCLGACPENAFVQHAAETLAAPARFGADMGNYARLDSHGPT
jgi:hypothetical protein